MRREAAIVLVCGAFLVTLSLGARAAFGLFLKPISQDLGLGREVFSLALAVATLITGIAGPFFGAFADRYGALRVAAIGGVFFVASLALGAFVQGGVGLQMTFGILNGIAMTATGMGIVFGAVARTVPAERRSMAFGVVMAGGSLGQFLMIPFAQSLLNAWDWRAACQILAVVMLLLIPLAWGLRDRGHHGQGAAAGGAVTLRDALAEATRHSGFWLLTASFFVCGFHVSFINTHLPAYLSDRGMSANVAANSLALVGLFNIFGSFASGWLGGRYRQRYILALVYLARAVIFVPLLVLPMTPTLAIVFSALMGLLYLSTVAPTSGIVAQIFGPRHFSMLYGIVFGSHQLGGFLGSWLGGSLFDRTGSYDVVWWLSIGLALAAAALAAPVRDAPLHKPAAA
jgi:predicted MFS family arabinose efflux permease